MPRYALPVLLLIALTIIALAGCRTPAPQADHASAPAAGPGIAWADRYDTAVAEAAAAGKPVMVDFWRDGCGWCAKFEAETLSDPQVQERAQGFIPVKVEINGPDAARAVNSGIRSTPTIVFLNSTGAEITRHAGFLDAGDFLKLMDQALAGAAKAPPAKPAT